MGCIGFCAQVVTEGWFELWFVHENAAKSLVKYLGAFTVAHNTAAAIVLGIVGEYLGSSKNVGVIRGHFR